MLTAWYEVKVKLLRIADKGINKTESNLKKAFEPQYQRISFILITERWNSAQVTLRSLPTFDLCMLYWRTMTTMEAMMMVKRSAMATHEKRT